MGQSERVFDEELDTFFSLTINAMPLTHNLYKLRIGLGLLVLVSEREDLLSTPDAGWTAVSPGDELADVGENLSSPSQ